MEKLEDGQEGEGRHETLSIRNFNSSQNMHHLPQVADMAPVQKVCADFCHGAVLINSSVDNCIYFSGSGYNWP
jgi:hypothetical protein